MVSNPLLGGCNITVLLRLEEEFQKCVETCNDVYAWYVRREGKYQADETAQSWLRIINENFNRAQVLHYVQHGFHMEDGSVPGIQYVPGPVRFSGKTS